MTIPMQQYSAGFVKELSYISLAYGLLHAAYEVEHDICEDIGVVRRGADYRSNKQIDRRVLKLKEELWQFMSKYMQLSEKAIIKNRKLFTLALSKIHNTIQLEYLAIYVLSLRFNPMERSKPLHDDFKWINEKEGQLFAILDLMEHMEASEKSLEMFYLANDIVKEL